LRKGKNTKKKYEGGKVLELVRLAAKTLCALKKGGWSVYREGKKY